MRLTSDYKRLLNEAKLSLLLRPHVIVVDIPDNILIAYHALVNVRFSCYGIYVYVPIHASKQTTLTSLYYMCIMAKASQHIHNLHICIYNHECICILLCVCVHTHTYIYIFPHIHMGLSMQVLISMSYVSESECAERRRRRRARTHTHMTSADMRMGRYVQTDSST